MSGRVIEMTFTAVSTSSAFVERAVQTAALVVEPAVRQVADRAANLLEAVKLTEMYAYADIASDLTLAALNKLGWDITDLSLAATILLAVLYVASQACQRQLQGRSSSS